MISYKVTLDLSDMLAIKGAITKDVFPLIHQAVRAIATHTAANWQQAVHQQRGLWSGEKDAYADSISWSMRGDFFAMVEATYEQASFIETGRPGRDLKKMLDTSPKVRRTVKGKRFLIIPFRHNTPGNNALAKAMPSTVYAMAKAIAPSKISNQKLRMSGEVTHLSPKTGMSAAVSQPGYLSNPQTKSHFMVNRNEYQWGGRLKAKDLAASGMGAQDVKRYAGMTRFNTSTPGATSSSFMTFRVMMEGQAGWITKAEPGRFIAKKIEDEMQPLAEKAFAEAVKRTLG